MTTEKKTSECGVENKGAAVDLELALVGIVRTHLLRDSICVAPLRRRDRAGALRISDDDARAIREASLSTPFEAVLREHPIEGWVTADGKLSVVVRDSLRLACDLVLNKNGTALCWDCGQEWETQGPPSDKNLDDLFGFPFVAALTRLQLLAHHNHRSPGKFTAARDAAVKLLHYRDLGAERLSEIGYVDAMKALFGRASERQASPLANFLRVAEARLVLERQLEGHTVGINREPRPSEITQAALENARDLARRLEQLESKWAFSSEGRTLQGTVPSGRPPKNLLATIEVVLADGGFSQSEIAALALDGQRADQNGPQRVRKRLQVARKEGLGQLLARAKAKESK